MPGILTPPVCEYGEGWYDTGDIIDIDEAGHLKICGRAKRFAKIGGEMVSLAAAEELANRAWPEEQHAVVSVPDAQKGEQLVLLTTFSEATRSDLLAQAKSQSIGEINIPRKIIPVDKMQNPSHLQLQSNGYFIPYIMHLGFVFN